MSSSSPASAIIRGPNAGAIRDLSGLSRPPDAFSASLPTGMVRNFATALPAGRTEARQRAIRVTDGKSLAMNAIHANVIPDHWEAGYHLELFEGQPMFCMVNHDFSVVPITTPMLNLRHLNTIFETNYQLAIDMLRGKEVVSAGYLTEEQVQKLGVTPTQGWHHLPFVRALLDDQTKEAFHKIRYLFEEGIRDRFNFFGFAVGQISEELDKKTTAVQVFGSIDSIENVWGDEVQAGDMLFFIFKRRDLGGGRFSGFGYHPWYGTEPPTRRDTVYTDVTGTEREGQIIFVGTLDRWVEAQVTSRVHLLESIGFKTPESERVFKRPEAGVLRITRSSRPDQRGIPWYY